MKFARFINDEGSVSTVNADNIDPIKNEEKYKGHLYCEDELCKARLFYVERQNPKLNRYFATYEKSMHREGCMNEIIRNKGRKKISLIRGEGSNVSDEHIMRTLKDAYKNYKNDLNPNQNQHLNPGLKKTPKKKRGAREDSEATVVSKVKESPSTTGTNVQMNGEKEPNIHRNEVSRMIVNKDEPFKEIHGLVKSVSDYDGEMNVIIKGINGGKCRIFFGTPFEMQHQQEYKLLHLIKKYLIEHLEKGEKLQFHCFGEMKEENDDISVQIYSHRHLLIDGKPFYEIVQDVQGYING